jgi:hypothetical protein
MMSENSRESSMNTEYKKVETEEPQKPSRFLKHYRHARGASHDLSKADPGCGHCYGTGTPGWQRITNGQPWTGKAQDEDNVKLTCACVVRAEAMEEYLKEKEEWEKTKTTETT